MVRIVLIASLVTALMSLVFSLLNGKIGYELYYSLYAVVYGLAPSVVVLVVITLYRKVIRQPVWAFLKVEILLGVLTLLASAIPFILLKLKIVSSF